MTTILEMVWTTLQNQIRTVETNLTAMIVKFERAEQADGVASSTLANAPLLATGGVGGGSMLWISDGRKSGEGAGAGTGVLAVYNPATDQWLNVADYSVVVT